MRLDDLPREYRTHPWTLVYFIYFRLNASCDPHCYIAYIDIRRNHQPEHVNPRIDRLIE